MKMMSMGKMTVEWMFVGSIESSLDGVNYLAGVNFSTDTEYNADEQRENRNDHE